MTTPGQKAAETKRRQREAMTPGQKAAQTKRRKAAARKASQTRADLEGDHRPEPGGRVMTTATQQKVSRPKRAKAIAETARPTNAGVVLELRLYLYDDEKGRHGNIYSPTVGGPKGRTGIPVRSDLDLLAQLAVVLGYVNREGSNQEETS
jgi:hypothetical protein